MLVYMDVILERRKSSKNFRRVLGHLALNIGVHLTPAGGEA